MDQVFPMVPASARAVWFLVPLGVLLVGLMVLFGYIAYSSRHVRFEVSLKGLKIVGDLYGRMISSEALESANARAIDLSHEPGYALSLRTNGVGLPGYQSGWFKLANGQKALVFLTDQHRVVCIPTTAGYTVLLSVADPAMFISTLRELVRAEPQSR